MSDGELRDELVTLLVAGHETTATSLAWAIERLVRHPAALERLREEAAGDDDAYLDAVVQGDAAPAARAADRRAQARRADGDRRPRPAGRRQPSRRASTSMHRRAGHLPRARTRFRPERFLERPAGHLHVDPVRRRRAPLPRRELRAVRDAGRPARASSARRELRPDAARARAGARGARSR